MKKSGQKSSKQSDRRTTARKKYPRVTRRTNLSPEETLKLINELQVYQVELEIKNEELRKTQIELEESRDRYVSLYDFAPVGYITLSDKGTVLEANLTAASQLGIERTALFNKPFSRFVHKDDRDTCYLFHKRILKKRTDKSCELRLRARGRPEFHAQLLGNAVRDDKGQYNRIKIAVIDITGHKQAEAASQKASMEKTMLNAEDRLRQNMAYELHDGLGQLLSAISLKCRGLEKSLQEQSIGEADNVRRITHLIEDAKKQLRLLMEGISPVCVIKTGIISALEDLAAGTAQNYPVTCLSTCENSVSLSDDNTALQLYHIASESVMNAVKHSRADTIKINLTGKNSMVKLVIKDNGKGIPEAQESEEGMGLHIMDCRARLIGASLKIKSAKGKGTSVTCSLHDKGN